MGVSTWQVSGLIPPLGGGGIKADTWETQVTFFNLWTVYYWRLLVGLPMQGPTRAVLTQASIRGDQGAGGALVPPPSLWLAQYRSRSSWHRAGNKTRPQVPILPDSH